MSLSLGAPLGLVALLGVPVLVALYFLRRRASPRTVSALFLWRATDEAIQAGPQMRRLQRETSLLLECAAVLCATAFLSDLRCGKVDRSAQHSVIVLDGSLSMRGGPAEGDRFADRARARALRWIDTAGVVTLVETGRKPRVLAGPGASPADAEKALRSWQPAQPAHPFEASWALARELAGPGARVRFITDALPQQVPQDLEVIAVGQPLANVAIVAAQRSDSDTQTHVRLQIARFSDARREAPLDLLDEKGALVRSEKLSLEPGRATSLRLDLPRQGTLTARLPDDALPDDGQLVLEPEPPRPVRVQNALPPETAAGEAIARILASAPDLPQATPAELAFVPPTKTAGPWNVTIGATMTDTAPLRTFVGPFFADRSHPLLEDVVFDGIVWTAGANPPGKPLVSAGDRVLVSEDDGGRFHFNIDLGRSNVQRENAWPLMLANLVDLRRRALPGLAHHNVALGEELVLGPGSAGAWTLRGSGFERALVVGAQPLAAAPGRYELLHDGAVVDHVSILGVDAQESDLRTRGAGEHAASSGEAQAGLLPPERSRWPLVLLVLVMLADYALAAPGRRRTFERGAA